MSAADLLSESGASHMMTLDEVERRAADVLQANPELTVQGWRTDDDEPFDRDFDMEQVWAAALFLLAFGRPQQTINDADEADSYILKHAVEHWTEAIGAYPNYRYLYIRNGAFILAAILSGYEFCRRPGDRNCKFNLVVDPAIHHYAYSALPLTQ